MSNGLPVWDLSDLYSGFSDPALLADIGLLENMTADFMRSYKGAVSRLDASDFAAALYSLESIQNLMTRIGDFAFLSTSIDMDDEDTAAGAQTVNEKLASIESDLLFFSLEINKMNDEDLEYVLSTSPALAHYRPWFRDVLASKPFQLSDDVETMLAEKASVGADAFIRLYDTTCSRLRYRLAGREHTEAEIEGLMTHAPVDLRRMAADAVSQTLASERHTFAFILNTIAKDKEIEDRARGFKHPLDARCILSGTDRSIITAMTDAVHEAAPRLSHRYYAMKTRREGVVTLAHYERNIPVADEADGNISWTDARDMVLNAYHEFSADMGAGAERFFRDGWIDALPRAGKDSGAFAIEGPTDRHPHILMNFQGRAEDVLTLAHEAGHGIHGLIASRNGPLMCDVPVTIAETASVFGEMLVFRALLAAETDPLRKKALIASKIEAMLDTTVRQVAIHDFETRFHLARKEQEIPGRDIDTMWLDIMGRSLGPSISFDESYGIWWARISHIFQMPFYVHAYAFGDCLVNSLYARYLDGHENFTALYLGLLRAGGTKRHEELLAPFGLDIRDAAFWTQGLSVIERLIDMLEVLDTADAETGSAGER